MLFSHELRRCSVTLMLGVPDEHNILQEGEVLVGNGKIQGNVLIFRPPCLMPGDIQKVKAVPGRDGAPFTYLKGTLVMSSKGERPLADMLAGGDYGKCLLLYLSLKRTECNTFFI